MNQSYLSLIVLTCATCFSGTAFAKHPVGSELDASTLELIEAKFGAFDSWVDLTDALRAQLQDGSIDLPSLEPIFEGIKDPAFGHQKSLVVVYKYRNQVRLKIVATDGAATRWGTLVLPELDQFRVRAFVAGQKKSVIDDVATLGKKFDVESDSYSLRGKISENKTGLQFSGQLHYGSGLMTFSSQVTLGQQLHANGGSVGGGALGGYLIFDRVDAREQKRRKTSEQPDKHLLKHAVERYEAEIRAANQQYAKQADNASDELMNILKKLQAQTAKSKRLHIVAAFYGQNISWLEVTDKVRAAVGKQDRWSTVVKTQDWGEPAPGFGAPRTLIVAYLSKGKLAFKASYQGSEISLP